MRILVINQTEFGDEMGRADVEYHIRCRRGDVARYVLLPGDPARAKWISGFFENAREIARNREYWTFTGTYKGVPISVTSTGIGCPSASIAVEELARCGARTFIRVGTSGGLQRRTKVGDLVVATAAVRDEGTTRAYVPLEFPAVASFEVVQALISAAKKLGHRYHVGVVHSKDSFYSETPKLVPNFEQTQQRWKVWTRSKVLATEMECAAIFTLSSIRGLSAGAVLAVIGEVTGEELVLKEKAGVEEAIRTALEAVKILEEVSGKS